MKEGWEFKELGAVSAMNYGYTENATSESLGPRFLRITDIQDDRVDLESDQEGDVRISLRDQIFREVVANLIIHREFLNPFPAKLIIEGTRVVTENSNRPHGYGLITPDNFSPYPKNPVIAKFFKQIGWADELGSGVRKLFRYSKLYSGREPELAEGDIFKVFVPLCEKDIKKIFTPQATPQVEKLLEFCREPRSREEMQNFLGLKDRKYFRTGILNGLIKKGALLLTIPDKPNSPKQKYYFARPKSNRTASPVTKRWRAGAGKGKGRGKL